MATLTLGTRGSPLALAQSRLVKERLEAAGDAAIRIRIIRTAGDRHLERSIPEIGGKGLFTAELDRALMEGEIDFAVHSLKDLPTEPTPGLVLAAVPEREDPRDVLVVGEGGPARITALARGACLGTSSARRRALALACRPDLDVQPIRGNVDTRLAKLEAGQYDALVLAVAGLRRLGLSPQASRPLSANVWLPAPGQGALALVAREGDRSTRERLAPLEHAPTRAAVTFERAFLSAVGGGCSAPVGAIGLPYDGGMRGWAMVASPDGARMVKADRSGDLAHPDALGKTLAATLVDRGALEILDQAGGSAVTRAVE